MTRASLHYKKLTKYCYNSSYGNNGFTDNLTTLEPIYDVAMSNANWGNGWRMPTLSEYQELYNNTTHSWTQQNGVNGLLLTAKDDSGNSLFLPAAGTYKDNGHNFNGTEGDYWSSTLVTDQEPGNAWIFCFVSYGEGTFRNERYCGKSVRAVYNPQN